ncbi:hypothetical protein [Nocardia sp. NPDC049707]|uniref:hypothetical protein n=1 Tax=Nocardia sp. NPDC049707 TaxID=3154735 RepID=UPI00341C04C4
MGRTVENGEFVDMVEKFAQDPEELRRLGDANRAASAPAYARAEGDPEWEAEFESRYGKAANAYRVFASRYIIERGIGYTKVGDSRNATGDNSTAAANAFETTDSDGGAQVRRTIPEA